MIPHGEHPFVCENAALPDGRLMTLTNHARMLSGERFSARAGCGALGVPECSKNDCVAYLPIITKWSRRFCAQHDSPASRQNGASFPRLRS